MAGESSHAVTDKLCYKQHQSASACVADQHGHLYLFDREWTCHSVHSSPVNHTFHRHINDPHYVAWPYGTVLCVCEHECLCHRVCSAFLKADCTGDEAKLLVTSLRISLPWLR
ncbi:Hypothetical predicted protein [Scomber scombrus]|uniref:Uncharacterized protein n=1 Tax=Scomber scombrus TaxID=13677 RepID=A0AAV1N0X6_SCOSC